jgi:hypothetical protein
MAGYSDTPLLKKLGIKTGISIYVYNPPAEYFNWLSPLPPEVTRKQKLQGALDFIHLFVLNEKTLQQLFISSQKHLKKDGMLWIS